jgi:hypothetical protein
MTQVSPGIESHPDQPPKVPVAFAVKVTGEPEVNAALQVWVQIRPGGVLVTVPVPVPMNVIVKVGLVALPVSQTTLTVIVPDTMAPVDEIPPSVLFFVMVAVTKPVPQSCPVAVSNPVELMVASPGVFETHVTWLLTSLLAGGWMYVPVATSCTFNPASAGTGVVDDPNVSIDGAIEMDVSCWSRPQVVIVSTIAATSAAPDMTRSFRLIISPQKRFNRVKKGETQFK